MDMTPWLVSSLSKYGAMNPHGTGIAWTDKKYVYMKKSADEAASWFVKERMRIISSASVGHVRFATNGGVKLCNSHPFISTREGCVIVHNGILRNFKAYKKDCKHIGLKFDSETDSEVLLKIVEREGPEKIYDVLERERIDGSANCIVLYAGGLMDLSTTEKTTTRS
jgi:glucosamine--fructose-6-phosphate aminotransferase (isomerizing)